MILARRPIAGTAAERGHGCRALARRPKARTAADGSHRGRTRVADQAPEME
jgi:hypothetical protein